MLVRVTAEAANLLRKHLSDLGDRYIGAIVWAEDEASEGAWELGFHLRADVPDEWIEVLGEGIEMVIEPHWRKRLEGKILDAKNGNLTVN